MFNAGVRGKRAKDGTGFISSTEQFVQQTYLIPTVTSFSVTDVSYVPLDNTAVNTAGGEIIVINGSGFAPGATVQVGATTIGSVTFIDQNRLAFSAPVLSSGSYTIYVTNSNGGTGILLSGLVYSGLPTYTTTAGTLGTIYETANINTAVVATGDAPITYSVISGTLPSGATLNSNGTITGNAPVDGSSTTYSFTIQATDAQLQDSTRAFTLTINTDVLTWGLANNTVYTLDGGTAMSNVTLSATSAANSNSAVTFAANTLPTGVSISGNTVFGTPTVEETIYTALTATATQTGRTATRFVTWVVSLADLFFDYTTLLIPGASTTFVDDASTNNFAVSIFGDTKPNNFNPYTPGYYSNYFDGDGDYLTLGGQSQFAFGAGSFTIEAWIYANSFAAVQSIIDFRPSTVNGFYPSLFINTSGTPYFVTNNTQVLVPTATITLRTWNHIALVKSGSTTTMYFNGVSVGTYADTNTYLVGANSPVIGINGISRNISYFNGYISNLRIVKGTAVYTTAFTPPTTPLTAIANTSLLTCQSNRFIDNSTNNFTLTVFGNTTINSFDPFTPNSSYSTYGSGYFDGTGDYLSVDDNSAFALSNSNFTLEAWIYPTATGNYPTIAAQYGVANNSSFFWSLGPTANPRDVYAFFYISGNNITLQASNVVVLNTWGHHAIVRNSGTLTYYINGVSVSTASIGSSALIDSTRLFTIGNSGDTTYTAYPFTGYITDVRLVKGTAVYTTTFTPPSAPLTAIANTSLLTLQNNQSVNNNVFLDNSTNNFLVTRAGNTTQGTFSPYGGNWSNYFDGTGDYLTLPSAPISPTGTFTFECWVFVTGSASSQTIYGQYLNSDTGRFNMFWNDVANKFTMSIATTSYDSASTYTPNVWYHIAWVRDGSNNLSLYVNGVRDFTTTGVSTSLSTSNPIIGARSGGTVPYTGYISNMRITNTAVYSGTSFTVSTTPLTPITGTRLLTCADNRLIDDSINNFTITKNGDVSVQRFSPFNPSSVTSTSYSGYFDGTGDYLIAPYSSGGQLGSNNFTIEFWIYFSSVASGQQIISAYTSTNLNYAIYTASNGTLNYYLSSNGSSWNIASGLSFGNISVNTWYHVALVRNGSTFTPYLNGTAGTTATSSSAIFTNTSPTYISTYFNGSSASSFVTGYISNLRIVNGTAVYTSAFTPPTTPLTSIANTSLLTLQSTTFIDNSTNNFTITAVGNSQPTIQNPFGYTSTTTEGYTVSTIGGSGYFDGSGDSLQAPSSASISGTGDFTAECWIYPTTVPGTYNVIGCSDTSGGLTMFGLNSNGTIFMGRSLIDVQATTSNSLSYNTWNHIAISRSSGTVRLFINGIQGYSGSITTNYNAGTVRLGTDGGGSSLPYAGYISNFRIITNSAIYTSNFVPSLTPLTAVQNTSLLTNMTGAGIYDASMMNNLETQGDAKLSTAISKFGGSSMSFDGSGDNVYIPNAPVNQLGTGDYTIEFWIYGNSWSTLPVILEYGRSSAGPTAGLEFYVSTVGGKLDIYGGASTATLLASYSSLSTTTWTHIALTRASSTTRLFINGTQSGSSATDSTNYNQASILVGIFIGGANPLNGYIDDLRITKGYARYTANFTAPLSAFKTK